MIEDFIYDHLPRLPYFANFLMLLGGMFLTLAIAYLISRWTEFLIGGVTVAIFSLTVLLACR